MGGKTINQPNKEADDFVGCQICHHFNAADMDILRTEKGWTKCIQILKVFRKFEVNSYSLVQRSFSLD